MAKKEAVVDLPVNTPIEMTYVQVGQPPARQFDTFDENGMLRVITTAKISNPSGTDQGYTLQEMLDAVAQQGWKPGPTFTCGPEKNIWILWREKVA